MKFAMLGVVCLVIATMFAGNWIYDPFQVTTLSDNPDDFMPVATFPADDFPDNIYDSELMYIPSIDMYCTQWNYVWLNASGHTPDEESVRVFIKDSQLDHIALCIHYKWMNVYHYDSTDNHVHISFSPVYHTPSVSPEQYITSGMVRIAPMLIFFIIGISLILIEITRQKTKK